MDFNSIFAERTKRLTISIINELSELPYSDKVSVIRKQIIRSSSSVAANYRAMCRARSNKEKYAKICIVVEEADETVFWLEIIEEIKMTNNIDLIKDLKNEAEEILKVMSSYRKKIGADL
jgi:four helix bundle protein